MVWLTPEVAMKSAQLTFGKREMLAQAASPPSASPRRLDRSRTHGSCGCTHCTTPSLERVRIRTARGAQQAPRISKAWCCCYHVENTWRLRPPRGRWPHCSLTRRPTAWCSRVGHPLRREGEGSYPRSPSSSPGWAGRSANPWRRAPSAAIVRCHLGVGVDDPRDGHGRPPASRHRKPRAACVIRHDPVVEGDNIASLRGVIVSPCTYGPLPDRLIWRHRAAVGSPARCSSSGPQRVKTTLARSVAEQPLSHERIPKETTREDHPFASTVLALAAAVSLAGCATNEAGPAGSAAATTGATLTGKGAPLDVRRPEAVDHGLPDQEHRRHRQLHPDGSGAGRSAFPAGAVSSRASDRAFKDAEMGAGKFAKCTAESNALNLPVYISPIAVVFNVTGVDKLNLDAATTAGIFSGAIKTWNDPKIVALNPGVTLPAANITAVHRSDDSGTTDNFTDTALAKLALDVWTNAVTAAPGPPPTPARPPRAPPALSTPSPRARTPSATSMPRPAAKLGKASIKVGASSSSSRPPKAPPRSSTPRRWSPDVPPTTWRSR